MNSAIKRLAQLTIINVVIFWTVIATSPSQSAVKSVTQFSKQVTIPTHYPTTATSTPLVPTLPQSTHPLPVSLSDQMHLHASREDCWMKIEGHVYDITAYFGSHPGGDQRLLAFCGTDATSAFHSKDGSGRDHSAAARSILQSFLIE